MPFSQCAVMRVWPCVWHVLLACWVPLEAPVWLSGGMRPVALPRADAGARPAAARALPLGAKINKAYRKTFLRAAFFFLRIIPRSLDPTARSSIRCLRPPGVSADPAVAGRRAPSALPPAAAP